MRYFVFYTIDYDSMYQEFKTEDEVLNFVSEYKLQEEKEGIKYGGNKVLSIFKGERLDIKPVEVVTRFELVVRGKGK